MRENGSFGRFPGASEDAGRVVVVVPRVPQRGGSGVARTQPGLLRGAAGEARPAPVCRVRRAVRAGAFGHPGLLGFVSVAPVAPPAHSRGKRGRLRLLAERYVRESVRPPISIIEAVSFFEPPPLPPEPPRTERWEPRAWEGPPEDVLGGVVALELLLARSQMAAVAIRSATAYRTGFEFTVDLRLREDREDRVWMGPPWEPRRSQSGELPDDLFRFGVQFEDGSKATTLDTGVGAFRGPRGGLGEHASWETFGAAVAEDDEPEERQVPDSPVLMPQGGGGGMRRWSESFWLWPLPPEGRLSFVCEWPAFGIALTRADVDTAAIRDAAARSRALWDDG